MGIKLQLGGLLAQQWLLPPYHVIWGFVWVGAAAVISPAGAL